MSKGKRSRSGASAGRSYPRSEVRAKKKLGQHFLKDVSIAKRIAETLTLDQTNNVIEIGPGTGILTRQLLERPIHLIAVELDRESVVYLNTKFIPSLAVENLGYHSLRVLEADFLNLDLGTLFQGEPYAITGNFPYNISSQIVFRLLEVRSRVPEFSGMFQKEVALNIASTANAATFILLFFDILN